MTRQEQDEWVAASLRYLKATCGATPWNDATSDDTGEEQEHGRDQDQR